MSSGTHCRSALLVFLPLSLFSPREDYDGASILRRSTGSAFLLHLLLFLPGQLSPLNAALFITNVSPCQPPRLPGSLPACLSLAQPTYPITYCYGQLFMAMISIRFNSIGIFFLSPQAAATNEANVASVSIRKVSQVIHFQVLIERNAMAY